MNWMENGECKDENYDDDDYYCIYVYGKLWYYKFLLLLIHVLVSISVFPFFRKMKMILKKCSYLLLYIYGVDFVNVCMRECLCLLENLMRNGFFEIKHVMHL